MKLLVDTQCWLWWFSAPDRLNDEASAAISDELNELWLSVASVWEIGIKLKLGILSLPEPLESYLPKRIALLNARSLEITTTHAIRAVALPPHHTDPFDRMLIAQSQAEAMTIVTTDRLFAQYTGTSLLLARK